MLNGVVQSMLSGLVPGNRNADNIDEKLRKCDFVAYTNQPIQTYGFKSAILKSFGFGQVGGEVLVVHPDYLLAQLDDKEFTKYVTKRENRKFTAFRHIHNSITNTAKYITVKEKPPFAPEDEEDVYLNPLARATMSNDGNFVFESAKKKTVRLEPIQKEKEQQSLPRRRSGELSEGITTPVRRSSSQTSLTNLEVTLREMSSDLRSPADRGIGVDIQLISEIEVSIENSKAFVGRNFTPAEILYCEGASDPISSFAGRWAAKEAVIKAISSCDTEKNSRNLWQGAGAPLRDIEILRATSGACEVVLHGHAKDVATLLGISVIKVTISHSGDYAIAHASAH